MLEAYEAEYADFQRLIAAVRRIQSASVEELGTLDWLVTLIREVGLVPIPEAERTYRDDAEFMNSSSQGVIQIPREFGRYLQLLGELHPANYLEVGTFNGATASLAAAYLRRFDPGFRAVTIDVHPHFLFSREIGALLPWLEFRVPCTSFDVRPEKFEAVFIDGDHSFEWAWADYQNVGRAARICAFHDVNNAPYREMSLGGVPAVWELLRQTEKGAGFHEFFEHPTEDLMGIGVRISTPK
jgi:hypothetical protein